MKKDHTKPDKNVICKNKHVDIEKEIWKLYKLQAIKEFDEAFELVLKEYLTKK